MQQNPIVPKENLRINTSATEFKLDKIDPSISKHRLCTMENGEFMPFDINFQEMNPLKAILAAEIINCCQLYRLMTIHCYVVMRKFPMVYTR